MFSMEELLAITKSAAMAYATPPAPALPSIADKNTLLVVVKILLIPRLMALMFAQASAR